MWNVPDGITITLTDKEQHLLQILVASTFKSGNIKVKAVAACGNGEVLLYPITTKEPGKPGPIKGRTDGICGPENVVEYSINPVPTATSYNWTTSVAGAVITSDGIKAL
jgi:hypothetical protein